jgi:hypothetical protein
MAPDYRRAAFVASNAATRDLIVHLRRGGTSNPAVDIPVRAVLAVGISQSGRYLRHRLGLA